MDTITRIDQKKAQLEALKPLPKETLKSLEEWLKVELTYTSNAIEGNTLTRIETAEIIEKGIAAVIPGKPLKDQLEARNHAQAVDFVQALAKRLTSHQQISEQNILDIHKIILSGIDDTWAGRYRESEVFIKGTTAELPQPQKVPYLMSEFVEWLNTIQDETPEEAAVYIAADAHFKFVRIHPFVDGNGRTGRLLMNLILSIYGYPPAVIKPEERTAYLDALNEASIHEDFRNYYQVIETAIERSLDTYLKAAKGKQALAEFASPKKPGQLLKIGAVARGANETVATIRWWTKLGLLSTAALSPGGYQLYAPSMVQRARTIRQLQTIKRLTLQEIQQELKKTA